MRKMSAFQTYFSEKHYCDKIKAVFCETLFRSFEPSWALIICSWKWCACTILKQTKPYMLFFFSFLILQSGVPVFCSYFINWKLLWWLCSLHYTYHRWNLKCWLSSANISQEEHICLIFMKGNWRQKSMYLAFILIMLSFLFIITFSYVCNFIVLISTLIRFLIYSFFFNAKINSMLNYPLLIRVNSNFCLVHL